MSSGFDLTLWLWGQVSIRDVEIACKVFRVVSLRLQSSICLHVGVTSTASVDALKNTYLALWLSHNLPRYVGVFFKPRILQMVIISVLLDVKPQHHC